jgi:hypothetical protein
LRNELSLITELKLKCHLTTARFELRKVQCHTRSEPKYIFDLRIFKSDPVLSCEILQEPSRFLQDPHYRLLGKFLMQSHSLFTQSFPWQGTSKRIFIEDNLSFDGDQRCRAGLCDLLLRNECRHP